MARKAQLAIPSWSQRCKDSYQACLSDPAHVAFTYGLAQARLQGDAQRSILARLLHESSTTSTHTTASQASWENTRWTGVVEKRDGRWVIVQQHFSFASDK
jgi:hypothetical protein